MSLTGRVRNLIKRDRGRQEGRGGKARGSEAEDRKQKPKEREVAPLVEGEKEREGARRIAIKEGSGAFALAILTSPHFTEKASLLAETGTYVFKVASRANKIQIKSAVEKVYGVRVVDVRVITVPAKRRVIRGIEGSKKKYKKAVVTLAPGHKIEV